MLMLQPADYLNAGVSEVEAASEIYNQAFPAVERIAHFCFNTLLICWLSWAATPIIILLVPITITVYTCVLTPSLSHSLTLSRSWIL
jgi:hypothetical protein